MEVNGLRYSKVIVKWKLIVKVLLTHNGAPYGLQLIHGNEQLQCPRVTLDQALSSKPSKEHIINGSYK